MARIPRLSDGLDEARQLGCEVRQKKHCGEWYIVPPAPHRPMTVSGHRKDVPVILAHLLAKLRR